MTYFKIVLGLTAAIALVSCGGAKDPKKPPKMNTAPMATATSFTTQAETKYMGTLMGTDADMDKLSFAVGNSPINGVLDLKKDGKFSYTPNAEFIGTDKFSFNVSDGKNSSASVDVNITVDLLEVKFSDYSRKAFNQTAKDKPLPLNSRKVVQDVTEANAYDDLLML
ncbi:MAG: Ig-like domain-containing protein [Cellvibrio sp.]